MRIFCIVCVSHSVMTAILLAGDCGLLIRSLNMTRSFETALFELFNAAREVLSYYNV